MRTLYQTYRHSPVRNGVFVRVKKLLPNLYVKTCRITHLRRTLVKSLLLLPELDNAIEEEEPQKVRKFKPAVIVKGPVNTTAYLRDRVELMCKTEGRPKPKIQWFSRREGVDPLPKSGQDFRVHKNGSLIFRDAQKFHDSFYHCVASNALNKATSKPAKLTVEGTESLDICRSDIEKYNLSLDIYQSDCGTGKCLTVRQQQIVRSRCLTAWLFQPKYKLSSILKLSENRMGPPKTWHVLQPVIRRPWSLGSRMVNW